MPLSKVIVPYCALGGEPFVEVQRYRPGDTYQSPQVVATFQPHRLSNIHSFSITENYAIFFFYPVIIDPQADRRTGGGWQSISDPLMKATKQLAKYKL